MEHLTTFEVVQYVIKMSTFVIHLPESLTMEH